MEIGLLLQMAEDLLKGQGKDKFARGEVDEAVTCQTLTCLPLHLNGLTQQHVVEKMQTASSTFCTKAGYKLWIRSLRSQPSQSAEG